MNGVLGAFVDLVFPPKCLTCGAPAEPFCAACRLGIDPAEDLPPPRSIDAVRSVGHHEGPLRRAVLRLKFERKVALVRPLAALLARELDAGWRAEALVPVPLHWTRRLERGFNQSELLAVELGRLKGLPVLSSLRRTRATGHQVGRRAAERLEGVRGAFRADPETMHGRRLVLIDDVWTTGATLAECAGVLRQAGAAGVLALTVTYEG
jgi:ComF family protein